MSKIQKTIQRVVEILSVKPKPAEVSVQELKIGEFFRWNDDIFIAVEFMPDESDAYYNAETGTANELLMAFSITTGDPVMFSTERVHRINLAKIEWEYAR